MQTLKVGDATVLGAAVMGAVGAGLFRDVEEGAAAMVRVDRTFEPDPSKTALYDELYAAFCGVYEGLSTGGAFGRIAAMQSG